MTMGKYIYASLFFLGYAGLFGQSPWDRIPLTGGGAKVIHFNPRYAVEINGIFPLKRADDLQIDVPSTQEIFNDPEVFEKLFERLGGEFFIGELSGPSTEPIKLKGRLQPMPGLKAGFRMGKRWEWQTGISLFRVNWSGDFPLTFYPANGDPPFSEQANMTATSEGLVADLALATFLTRTPFRPFVRLGARGQFPIDQRSRMHIRDVSIDRGGKPVEQLILPFGGIGLRFIPTPHFLIDLGSSFSQLPGMKWTWSAEFSSGILF